MYTMGWLILFIILLMIEIFTMGLTTIWFAGGALLALLMAFIGFGLPVQIVVFVLASGVLLIMTRPVAVKYFNTERQ